MYVALMLSQYTTIAFCRRSQTDSATQLATARYSASALERETVDWRLEDQETRLSPRNTQKPEVDFLVSGQPAQSASEYAVRSVVELGRS
jgi:hypothetical protein